MRGGTIHIVLIDSTAQDSRLECLIFSFTQSALSLGIASRGPPLHTKIDDEELILEVEKNEILYNKSSKLFKDSRKKQDVYLMVHATLMCRDSERLLFTSY